MKMSRSLMTPAGPEKSQTMYDYHNWSGTWGGENSFELSVIPHLCIWVLFMSYRPSLKNTPFTHPISPPFLLTPWSQSSSISIQKCLSQRASYTFLCKSSSTLRHNIPCSAVGGQDLCLPPLPLNIPCPLSRKRKITTTLFKWQLFT